MEIVRVTLDVNTLVVAAAGFTLGLQAGLFAVFAQLYAVSEGFLPPDRRVERFLRMATLERTLLTGALLVVLGLVGMVAALGHWRVTGFGALNPRDELRMVVPSVTAIVVGVELALAGLFVSILGIRHSRMIPPPIVWTRVDGSELNDLTVMSPNGRLGEDDTVARRCLEAVAQVPFTAVRLVCRAGGA